MTASLREHIGARVDAPLGPALRLAACLGGAGAREAALERAHARGRERDVRHAMARVAAARTQQIARPARGGAVADARRDLLAARRAALAARVQGWCGLNASLTPRT